MTRRLDGALLTETAAAALSLASTRRHGPLTTQQVLLAARDVDAHGNWGAFIVDDRPLADGTEHSDDTWSGVPLTRELGRALTVAERLAEAYDLRPLPVGGLVLALLSEVDAGASRSLVGVDHDEAVALVQDVLLGTDLERVEELLTAPGRASAPAIAALSTATLDGVRPGPRVDPEAAQRAFARATTRLPLTMLRLLSLLAVAAVVYGVASSPAWTFRPGDDLIPPIARPAVANAIPSDARLGELLGTDVVRTQDGRPESRLFDSRIPFAVDARTSVVKGAWSGRWTSTDGGTVVLVQIVQGWFDADNLQVLACAPTSGQVQSDQIVVSGYVWRETDAADYCSIRFHDHTQVEVRVASNRAGFATRAPDVVQSVQETIAAQVPPSGLSGTPHLHLPFAAATIERSFLLAVVAAPLLLAGPALLFDRATWQRVWWVVGLKRWRTVPTPPADFDRLVRERLWSVFALACTQVAAAVWALRLTAGHGFWITGIVVFTAVVLVSALPRVRHLRRGAAGGVRRRGAWLVWTATTLLGLAGFLAALGVVYLAVSLSVSGFGNQTPDYVQQRLEIVAQIAAIGFALVGRVPAMFVRRLWMRSRRQGIDADQRPPVLLLRSFADDGRRLRARSNHRRSTSERLTLRRWERFEEVVSEALGDQGPVYAVGQVGERLPPALGAVRRQFSDAEWQDRVGDLMTGAAVIAVVVGRSAALEWELRRIRDNGLLHKTVFVFPPTKRFEHQKRLAVLANVMGLNWADVDVRPAGAYALTVYLPGLGETPRIVHARSQDDVGYDIALAFTRTMIAGLEVDDPASPVHVAPPAAEFHAPGRAPKYEPVVRRPTTWIALSVASASFVALVSAFVFGETSDASSVVPVKPGMEVWAAAADHETGATYSIVDGDVLFSMDFGTQTGAVLCRIERADALVAASGRVFPSNAAAGTLQGVDPVAKKVLWTADDVAGVRGVTVVGDRVYAALPAQHEVRVIDAASGRTLSDVPVDGTPWAIASDGRALYVALVDRDEVDVLDIASSQTLRSVPSPPGPTQVAVADGTVWVYSVPDHRLTAVDGPGLGRTIGLISEAPHIASNGTVLAVEGVEQVTTLWPDGTLRRNRLPSRHAQDLAVTATGDVVSVDADQSMIRLLRPPEPRQ